MIRRGPRMFSRVSKGDSDIPSSCEMGAEGGGRGDRDGEHM